MERHRQKEAHSAKQLRAALSELELLAAGRTSAALEATAARHELQKRRLVAEGHAREHKMWREKVGGERAVREPLERPLAAEGAPVDAAREKVRLQESR